MAGSCRRSIRILVALTLAACVEERAGVEGTQSLRVTIVAPADVGGPAAPLEEDAREVTIGIVALDERGEPDRGFEAEVDVYTHFLGTLTPRRGGGALPLRVPVAAGEGGATLTLPRAFGPTFLWVEDADGPGATFATGTSGTIWYRDPYLDDVQRPEDEARFDALERSPLEGKQVRIAASRHGEAGALVVTGVYAQGFTASDADCAASPCQGIPYGHVFVYTFGRPRADDGRTIRVGHAIAALSGGVGEFNGTTQLNFPRVTLAPGAPDEGRVPAPAPIDGAWLGSPSGEGGMINLERLESALVAVDGGILCPLDEDFARYGQWKLDVGRGCGRPINVVTAGPVSDFDPAPYVGLAIPRVVGTLRAVNIGTFHVWIVHPRRASDLTLP